MPAIRAVSVCWSCTLHLLRTLPGPQLRDLRFDVGDDAVGCVDVGEAQGVPDRLRAGAAVSHQARALHAQERGATVLRVVGALRLSAVRPPSRAAGRWRRSASAGPRAAACRRSSRPAPRRPSGPRCRRTRRRPRRQRSRRIHVPPLDVADEVDPSVCTLRSSSCACWTSVVPLTSSSPTDSRATRGRFSTLSTLRA